MKRIVTSSAIALVLVASLGLASCTSAVEAKTGTIEVRVTDAPPGYEIKSIMVTVEEEGIEIHRAVAEQVMEQNQEQGQQQNLEQMQQQEQNQEDNGEWITIPIIGDNPFDLSLLEEQELVLATQDVPVGKYTQIRMTIEKVEVTYRKNGDEQDTTVEAKLPSGKLKFVRPFDVAEGETTSLILDFIADESVIFTGAQKNDEAKVIVKPVVKLDIQQGGKPHQLATVEGTISAVDTEASTISIIPTGETEAIVLDVNPQTEITLDGDPASLGDLDGLGEGNSVTARYYIDNLKATQIDALSPPG